ncbi:DNA/RNA non-specific endonuclease [Gallaecimonas kandeliae]|uniref:DNA/RNA non-specific endonuclease n=1 Tax=Gallaecimonas kandeliae TaxID=3029055 RepID=UPI002649CFEC|nr:DNA/RNA non-specific endonuclease [Gallaecimonas kandeliae]WKE67274.1 DNA/RNA non-specific endonuclease [Gallaecimonas kandeliae]
MKKWILISALVSASAAAVTSPNCLYGCPEGAAASDELIFRDIYTLSNNKTTKFADWAAYVVTQATIDGPTRKRYWKADPELPAADTLEPADYTGANAELGTDRGHQVPLASFSNTSNWAAANYLSNITPQNADLNEGAWEKLENAVRSLVRAQGDTYVLTGPLYERYWGTLPGADESHVIPSGYWKIVVRSTSQGLKASAFIMDQDTPRSDSHCGYQTTIDEVEYRTGLNVLPQLPAATQDALEASFGGLASDLGC